MKRLVLPLFAFLLSLPLFAQDAPRQAQPRFGEKIDVNLVLLDAVVTDRSGNQILGLGKDDFVVRENGVPQKVDSVSYFTNRTLLDSPEEKAPFKVERVHENRYFVFFFDKPSGGELWDRVARARAAASRFVSRLHQGDVVAVAGHDMRLKIYSDFTSDRTQLKRAIDTAAAFGPGITEGDGPIMKAIDHARLMSESGTVYEALEVLGDALKPTRGRKELLLFSAGILEPGQEVRGGVVIDESRYYRPMVEALNAGDVSVYGMNLLGDSYTPPLFHQTLERVAADTNGDYFRNAVNFETALNRIERQASGYYLISYYSNHEKGTRGYQKVDVSVPAGLRVKARAGYTYGE